MALGLTIGVTFYLHDKARSIFANGGHQNTVFLLDALAACPSVGRVIAVNGGPGETAPEDMLYGDLEFKRFEEVADELDVYIECGAQIPKWHAEQVHANGGKVVAYKFGNAFVLDLQKVCDGRGNQDIFNGTKFDVVWTNPQHVYTNASYWAGVYRCPVAVLPHIWDETFVERVVAKRKLNFGYMPGKPAKRIAIFEPNIEVVKSCHIPMLACDLAFRQRPELIDTVWVTNTDHLRNQLTFKKFYLTLDIGTTPADKGGCSCESRYNLIEFQSQHADICVSWQWENALNYAYYELLYGQYPLVHNSEMLPVGYRYHGFDAHDGARALLMAITEHDNWAEQYNADADAFLQTVKPSYQPNIDAHENAIQEVRSQRLVA